jgi:hypothetical protein
MSTQVKDTVQKTEQNGAWETAGAKQRAQQLRKKANQAARKGQETDQAKLIASLTLKATENKLSGKKIDQNALAALEQRRTQYIQKVQKDRVDKDVFKSDPVLKKIDELKSLIVGSGNVQKDEKTGKSQFVYDDMAPLLIELDCMAALYRDERRTYKDAQGRAYLRNKASISVSKFLQDNGIDLDEIVVPKKGNNEKDLTVFNIIMSEKFERDLISAVGTNFHQSREMYGKACESWIGYYVRYYRGDEKRDEDLSIELNFQNPYEEVPQQKVPDIEADFPDTLNKNSTSSTSTSSTSTSETDKN